MIDDFVSLLKIVAASSVAGAIGGAVAMYFSSYLAQKAILKAQKEDIEEITDATEKAKSTYTIQLEQIKIRHQLRLAAIDKRLQAHQEAWSLWSEMIKTGGGDEAFNVLHAKCSLWWDNNCLYLEPKVRSEFLNSMNMMLIHHSLLREGQNHIITFDSLHKLYIAINEATDLPPLSTDELAIIKKISDEGSLS